MLDKILTLLSGNVVLFMKAFEKKNEEFSKQFKQFQDNIQKDNEKVIEKLSSLDQSISSLAEAVSKQPPIEVAPPVVNVPPFPEVKVPPVEVKIPEIKLPKIEVTVPPIKVPTPQVTVKPQITVEPTPVKFPAEMVVKGFSDGIKSILKVFKDLPQAKVYTQDDPLPVAFIDRKGRRYDLVHLGSAPASGGGATPSEITGADKTMRTMAFDISATGTVIPTVSGRRIKVYAIKLTTDAPVSVAFRDGASTLLEGMQDYLANSGYIDNIQPPAFLMATSAGNSLDLVVSGTGNVSGRISYWSDDKI